MFPIANGSISLRINHHSSLQAAFRVNWPLA